MADFEHLLQAVYIYLRIPQFLDDPDPVRMRQHSKKLRHLFSQKHSPWHLIYDWFLLVSISKDMAALFKVHVKMFACIDLRSFRLR